MRYINFYLNEGIEDLEIFWSILLSIITNFEKLVKKIHFYKNL